MYFGPPNPRSSLVLALIVSSPAQADDLFLDSRPLPQVLTATRLKQSPAAVPGSMTVIDSELIRTSGNQAAVNYHGTNASEARRMQVLIDGRSKDGTNQRPYTYRPVFSGITAAGDNSDVIAKDYAGSLRWNLDINPDHSLYIQGSAQHWLLQGGAMFEDTRLTGSSLTPRVAVNYLINPRHGLRAVYSEAIRSPDMFENNVNWSYRITNLSPRAYGQSRAQYFVKTRGPGDLEQEHMRSRELGYNGFFADIGLTVDAKLFYDEITGMISEPLRNNQYIASNSNSSRFSGTETQLDWRMNTADRLRLTYAYASNPPRLSITPMTNATFSTSARS